MGLTRIDSAKNPRIVATAKLLDRRARAKTGLFLIEGWRLVKTALMADAPMEEIYATEAFLNREGAGMMTASLLAAGTRLYEVSEDAMKRLTDTVASQGVVAVCQRWDRAPGDVTLQRPPLLVVADAVTDPGNLGALIRVSDAVGADALIQLPGCCDWTNPKVLRASMGSVFHLPVLGLTTEAFFDWATHQLIQIAATGGRFGQSIYDIDLTNGLAVVFGNEAAGVSETVEERADLSLSIPMPGQAESLNVTTAAAVVLFEAARQRANRPLRP